MKNENVYMQDLHRKLVVLLVQILRYNSSETDYSFCEDSPTRRTPPSTQMQVSPSDPFRPPLFFSHRRLCDTHEVTMHVRKSSDNQLLQRISEMQKTNHQAPT